MSAADPRAARGPRWLPSLPLLFGLQLGLLVLVLGALAFLSESTRREVSAEGGPVETASAVLFLVGALVGGSLWLRARPRRGLDLLWPLGALMGFLDETSFAETFLEWSPPYVQGVKLDAFHDLIDVLFTVLRTHFLKANLLLAGGALLLLVVVFLFVRRDWVEALLRSSPPLRYTLLALAWLIPATAVDLWLIENNSWTICLEELCEAMSALTLLAANLALPRARD